MYIKKKIFMLITHLILVALMLLILVIHTTTGNAFGIVTAIMALICWLGLTIFDIMDIKRYYK